MGKRDSVGGRFVCNPVQLTGHYHREHAISNTILDEQERISCDEKKVR